MYWCDWWEIDVCNVYMGRFEWYDKVFKYNLKICCNFQDLWNCGFDMECNDELDGVY